MTARVFPHHITTPAEAHDFLLEWAEQFGGELRDGIHLQRRRDGTRHVDDFHIAFPTVGTVLTVMMDFDDALVAYYYKFDLRRSDGTLLWREDNHPGHENEHGGPCHLHIGPQENHRVPSTAATLASVADKVAATNATIR